MTHLKKFTLLSIGSICFSVLVLYAFPSETKKQTKPPIHKKHLFRNPDGTLYTPLDLPVYLHISTHTNGQNPLPIAEKIQVPLTEGLNILRKTKTKTTHLIYADGTPPITTTNLTHAPRYVRKKHVYYGKGLILTIDTKDNIAGVKETYFSVNNQPFQPLEFPFTTFNDIQENHLRYYSVDNVGNTEPIKEIRFYHDPHPPQTHLEPTQGFKNETGSNFMSPRSTLSLNAEDNLSGVDSTYYRLDNGKKHKYKKTISLQHLDEGSHQLHYYSVDHTENKETEKTYPFIYDHTPPRVSARFAGEQYKAEDILFVAANAHLHINADDNGAGTAEITYQTNKGKPQTYTGTFPLPKQSGTHKIRYSAVDHLGNHTPEQKTKAYMDLKPPESTFQLSGSYFKRTGAYIIREDTRVYLIAADLESGVKELTYRIGDGEWKHYKEPLSFTEDGEYTLTYRAVDRVDNREKEKILPLVVNNTFTSHGFHFPPSPHPREWYTDEKGQLTGPADFPFYVVISPGTEDDAPGFLLDLKKMAAESGKPITFKKGGDNYLRLSAGPRDETFSLRIDDTPPRTRATFTGAVRQKNRGSVYFGPGLIIELSAEDNPKGIVSGNRETRVSIDGSEFSTYNGTLNIFSREKNYLFRFYSVDNVGNVEPMREMEFIVDTTPPRTLRKLESTAHGKILSGSSVITLSTSDNLSGVKALYYRFDDGEEKRYTKPLTGRALTTLPDGPHTLYYFAGDVVGNREDVQKYPFYFDNTEPAVGLQVLGDRRENKEQIYVSRRSRVRLTAAKKAAEVKDIRFQIGSAPSTPYNSPFSLPLKEGPHTVSYRGIDRTGNKGPLLKKTLFLDLTAPATSAVFNGPRFQFRGKFFVGGVTAVELRAEDRESGTAAVFYRLDKGRKTLYKSPLKGIAAGPHTIAYYAVDKVSNRSETKKIDFQVDDKPPKLRITYDRSPVEEPAGGLPVFPPGVLVYITALDEHTEVDRITYSLNGGPAVLYRNPPTDFEPGKTVVLEAHAVDRLQNRSKITVKFRIEAEKTEK